MDRMKKKAVEMPGLWTPRKTKGRFPSAPTALGNRWRDSHISTASATRGKVENQKQVSHFPTYCFLLKTQLRKEALAAVAPLSSSGSFFNEKMLWGWSVAGVAAVDDGGRKCGGGAGRRRPANLLNAEAWTGSG
jgi:hypothetical protein